MTPAPSVPVRGDALAVGGRASVSRVITASDIALYAGVTADFAPHHIDHAFGKATRFGSVIAHGLFIASLLDGALVALLPGGSLPVSRTFRFTAPVLPGDAITAAVEVTGLAGREVTVQTTCTNQRGEVVVAGTATERLTRRRA
ncbi:MAG: MaoC family dehydratase [Candidatus Rokubacteria bacterium]|nr:MaoC family dehydratase [Candidatus Rokubacteria bacterium]